MANSLKDKFQFKNVARLAVRNAPESYVAKLEAGLEGIEILAGPDAAADAVLLFVNNLAEAQALAPGAVATVAPAKAGRHLVDRLSEGRLGRQDGREPRQAVAGGAGVRMAARAPDRARRRVVGHALPAGHDVKPERNPEGTAAVFGSRRFL